MTFVLAILAHERPAIIAEPEHGAWNSYSIGEAKSVCGILIPHRAQTMLFLSYTSKFGLIRKRACAKHACMDVHMDVHVAVLGLSW